MYNEDINKGENFLICSVISMMATLVASLYDIKVTQVPFTWVYGLSHLFFFLVVGALSYSNKKNYRSSRVIMTVAVFSLFLILKTKYITILYSITVLQVAFILTTLIILERRLYLFLNFALIIGTISAILLNTTNSPYVTVTLKMKYFMGAIYLQMHLFMILIYSFGIYPKIKRLIDDLKFSSIGKSTSFIIHELAKPVSRLSLSNGNNLIEITEIQEMLTIAQELRANSVILTPSECCLLYSMAQDRLVNYESFLKYYEIQVENHIPQDFSVYAPTKYINIILDNIIRNAIEATKEVNPPESRFIKLEVENKELIVTNSYKATIEISRVFEANASSKVGNMGMGLYLCNNFAQILKWDLKVSHQKKNDQKIFKVSLTF